MDSTLKPANAIHERLRAELVAVIFQYKDQLSGADILAIASHLVGQIIALQDQRVISVEIANNIVTQNIQQGNLEAINKLLGSEVANERPI